MRYPPPRAPRCATTLVSLALCTHALACSREPASATDDAALVEVRPQPVLPVVIDRPTPPAIDAGPPDAAPLEPMGEFELTYYWMARPRETRQPRDVILYTPRCRQLAKVSREFAQRLALEGTGVLRDGTTINAAGDCQCEPDSTLPCFFAVDAEKRWGVGVAERPLDPYRSVAVDTKFIPIGTKLYIPALDGLTMPGPTSYGGFVHDGCVVADDTGGRVGQGQLDLFMVFRNHYESFDRRHRLERVQVFDGTHHCGDRDHEGIPAHRNAS